TLPTNSFSWKGLLKEVAIGAVLGAVQGGLLHSGGALSQGFTAKSLSQTLGKKALAKMTTERAVASLTTTDFAKAFLLTSIDPTTKIGKILPAVALPRLIKGIIDIVKDN